MKDKRPTISPNFNFLGQLLDYEKHLKEESENLPQTNAALKRQCIAELRSPTSPTVATPKMGYGQFVCDTKLTAQSPTTALAKLSFTTPSPSTPTKDTAEFPSFTGFPTSSLDLVSFVPCSVKNEISAMSEVKNSGGTKRPHSFSLLEQACDIEQLNPIPVHPHESQKMVTMRSPSIKAKIPSVRPNSISFSSYPKFDMCKEDNSSPEKAQANTSDNITTAKQSTVKSTQGKLRLDNNNDNGSMFIGAGKTNIRENLTSGNLEHHRKSRSYEDILCSPYEEEKCASCNNLLKNSQQKFSNIVESFAQPITLESCGCRGTSDAHQSNSSISSSGSHNSIHGSLELIPVS